MVITYERVSTAKMRLTTRQRVRLAHQVSRFVTPTTREIRKAWAKEIQRRIAEIDAGIGILVPADQAIAEARRAVERVRQTKARHSTIEIENAWHDEVERRIRLHDAGLIDDIDAEDLNQELRSRLR